MVTTRASLQSQSAVASNKSLGTVKPKRTLKNNDVEYFVSFCVMTEGANPMGHSFMLVSQLDHSEDDKARMEVVTAIGAYSRYMPLLGFKPYAVAKIKLEDMDYVVNRGGLSHATFQIGREDVEKVLDYLYQAKLKIALYDNAVADNRTMPQHQFAQVPMFNAFKKQNCKKYILEALDEIGIDTRHLSSFMELPILTYLDKMSISEEENRKGEKTYYWSSPMCFTQKQHLAQETQPGLNQSLKNNYSDLYQLHKRTTQLLDIIEQRQTELRQLGKTVRVLNSLERDVLAIHAAIEKSASYPKLITREQNCKLALKLTNCVNRHVDKLKAKQIESNLINVLKDVLQELYLYCKQYLVPGKKNTNAKFNTLDKEVFDKIQIADAHIRENEYASDVLPNNRYRRAGV